MPDDTERDDEVTKALKQGPGSLNTLWPLLYEDLRRRARQKMRKERAGHTLDPTDLLHDVYLRLASQEHVSWQSRGKFFAHAAQIMRHMLVDHARKKQHRQKVTIDIVELPHQEPLKTDVLVMHEVLARLEPFKPQLVRLIELRFFAGFTESEAAEILGLSRTAVQEEWKFGKPLLIALLREHERDE